MDDAIPREEITEEPALVLQRLREIQREHGKIDAIVASSGYGVPLKSATEATDADIALATFITKKDVERRLKIVGLRELMLQMREARDLNLYFTPGVIHLPTVPAHRKANRIDLGTSDKVYTAALAIKDHAKRYGIGFGETSLIVVEIGFSYTSAMAVRDGKIIDAMAGTAGFPGYMGMGFMDSELAYAYANSIEDFSKAMLFQGGAAHVAGLDPLAVEPEEFVKMAKKNWKLRAGYDLMLESIVKDVSSLLPSVKPKEVILSGRFCRIKDFLEDLRERLQGFLVSIGLDLKVLKLKQMGKVSKEAAEGSSLIANGLAGGKYEALVETMKIKESGGTIFDHVHVEGKKELLGSFGLL